MGNCRHILLALGCTLAISCGNGGKKASQQTARPFPVVQVPAMMDSEQKLDFLLEHFWDNMLDTAKAVACDISLINGVEPREVEQALSNYIMLLEQTGLPHAQECVARLASGIVLAMQNSDKGHIAEGLGPLVEKYMYDPNSPMRDEDLYSAYALEMSRCTQIGDSRRKVYAYQAEVSSLNARGSRAADFAFSDRNGKVRRLYDIDADYTILFFSNPGCTACRDIINVFIQTPPLVQLVEEDAIAVVNIYIDEDLSEWYKYMSSYPDEWYNVYDHNHIIRDEELYNVRAIPSLYLLDKDKTVILKDAPVERLLGTLQNIFEL